MADQFITRLASQSNTHNLESLKNLEKKEGEKQKKSFTWARFSSAPQPIPTIQIFSALKFQLPIFPIIKTVGSFQSWNINITILYLLRGNNFLQGPRYLRKQKQPWGWSTGSIPPPLDVSMASIIATTSSISGRLSGLASQHRFITFAKELGQHLGISGLRFCGFSQDRI